MAKVTDPQQSALVKLKAHGGEGVLDKHGKIVASGVRLTGFDAVTWLRLLTTGHIEVRGDLRVGLTQKGEAAAIAKPVRINPHGIHSRREPTPAHPGAE
ncbi:hypothetical protein [Methylobacterium komagatae]